MYYVTTVLLITSILSIVITVVQTKKQINTQKALKILQDQSQEVEQGPDDQLKSFKQKIDHARKMLVPPQIWKKGQALEDVSYIQGRIDTLDWLEQNHTRAPLNIRHRR